MPRRICCDDLAVALRWKVMKETYLGFCFIVLEDDKRRQMPIHFCPWCRAELAPEGERAAPITYPC